MNPQSERLVAAADLPQRWHGLSRFVVLQAPFGLGETFLAIWAAWRSDPHRCPHLHVVALAPEMPSRDNLAARVAASLWPELGGDLVASWPPRTPDLHLLLLDEDRVSLLLVSGALESRLPALHFQAHCLLLEAGCWRDDAGAGPLLLSKALGRKSAPGALLLSTAPGDLVRPALRTAGFVQQAAPGTADIVAATYRPAYTPRLGPRPGATSAGPAPSVLVVGAGLAGAAVARALARQGLKVTVLEQQEQPATRGSGQVAGLFHGVVHGDTGPHGRLFRAAAITAQAEYQQALGSNTRAGPVPGSAQGLLRLQTTSSDPHAQLLAMRQMLLVQGLPPDYAQALSAAEASQLAGVGLKCPAWFFPGGGWISPPRWIHFALGTPGIDLRLKHTVVGLRRKDRLWQAVGTGHAVLAEAEVVVLAHTHDALQLLQALGHPPWPVTSSRGQITHWASAEALPRLPVAGDGYALHIPEAGPKPASSWMMCGATSREAQADADESAGLCAADHQHNLERLARLTGQAPAAGTPLSGRAAWRLHTADRLPIAGPLPLAEWSASQRSDQPRLLPREPGLYVMTALGSRGLTLAPLLAQLLAAQICGSPWPLEQDLVDAVDPARWRVRASRRVAGQP